MPKTTVLTWVFLIILTIASALISSIQTPFMTFLILGFAALKFTGVAYEFMDLKKAHPIWGYSLLAFLLVFMAVILVMI